MRDGVIICILLAVLLGSCSTSRNYHIDSDYRQDKIISPVLILPIDRAWFDSNTLHTFGNLSGIGRSVFYSSLSELMGETITSDLKVVEPDREFPDTLFETARLDTEKNTFTVMIPRKNSDIAVSGFSPRIILVLDQYYYREEEKTIGGSSYAGHEPETKNFLYFETKYVYWDTQTEKPAAWGVSDASVQISKAKPPAGADYQKVLSRAVAKIAEKGPVI